MRWCGPLQALAEIQVQAMLSATDQINRLLDQLSTEVTVAIGRIAAAWVYLETEFDLALACLLTDPRTKGLHDDYILLPFKSRLAIVRAAGKLVYTQSVFVEFERVLSKVANAHGKRDPIIHGRFIAEGAGSCTVENHRHTGKGGDPFKITYQTYSAKQLTAISNTIVDAAGTFVAFNRQNLRGRPAAWLDIRRRPSGQLVQTLPPSIQTNSKLKKRPHPTRT
jgi:hypothetical protein